MDFERMRAGCWTLVVVALPALLVLSVDTRAESFDEKQAVERALATSSDISYQSSVQAAKELAFQMAIRAYLPKLSLSYDDNTTVIVGAADSRGKAFSASLTQSLFHAGGTLFDRPIQALELRIARSDLNQKTQALESTVRQAFGALALALRKKGILERTLSLARENLSIAQAERRLGSALEVDVMDIELQVLDLELSLSDTENNLAAARYQLRNFLNLEPDSPLELRVPDQDDYPGLNLQGQARIVSQALSYSLDLKKQEFTIAQAQTKVSQAGLTIIPNIDLELTASFTGLDFPLRNPNYGAKISFSFPFPESPTTYSATGFGTSDTQKGAGFSVKTNPFDNVGAWLDARSAELAFNAEIRKKEQMTKDLEFQVRQALGDYQQTERTLDLTQRKWTVQKKKLAILKASMDLGETKRIDYMKGLVDMSTAEIAVAEARQKLKAADLAFMALLGVDETTWNALWPVRTSVWGGQP